MPPRVSLCVALALLGLPLALGDEPANDVEPVAPIQDPAPAPHPTPIPPPYTSPRRGAESDDAPIPIGKLTRPPVPRYQSRPVYPVELRTAGITGEVWVRFIVKRDGSVDGAEAIRSSDPRFNGSAVAAVSSWRFRPGEYQGQVVNTLEEIQMIFSLDDDKAPDAGAASPSGSQASGPVFDVSKVDLPPIPVYQGRPVYPRALRESHTEGSATIRFLVNVDGSVSEVKVDHADAPAFGEAAAAAVSLWRFRPARIAGQRVRCRLTVPILFSLH